MKIITINLDDRYNTSPVNSFYNGVVFTCRSDKDIYSVYSALGGTVYLKNPDKDIAVYETLKGRNVKTLLKDVKDKGLISDYTIECIK